MKRRLFIILLFLLCFRIYSQEDAKVLFISSYHPGFSTFFQQVNGLKNGLDNEEVILDLEFMDMKRFPDDLNRQRFIENLNIKLNNLIPYDIIVVGDDYAFNFALEYQKIMFHEIPIIFLGVNNIPKAIEQNNNPYMTGVVEAVSMMETLELILTQIPGKGEIIAISDNTESGKADKETFLAYAKDFPEKSLSVLSLEDLSWNEFEDQIKKLEGRNTSLLLLSAYTDMNNETKSFIDAVVAIKGYTNLPIYHLWEHGIGAGLLGGKVIRHFQQGEIAGELVKRLLSGESIYNLRVIEKSPNQYLFDYNELMFQEVDLKSLPEGSLVENLPYSFFSENKRSIISSIVIFCVLVLVIIIMIYLFSMKNKLNNQLEIFYHVIEQSPISILITDYSGTIEYVNPKLCEITGYTSEELIGKNPRQFKCEETQVDYLAMWEKLIGGNIWEGQFINKKKNGDLYRENAIISPLKDEKGRIVKFCATKEDVTKLFETKIQSDLFRFVVDNNGSSVEILDIDEKITYVNEEFERRTGFLYEDVVGKLPLDIFGDETTDNAEIEKDMWGALRSGKPWVGRYTNKTKSGSFLQEDVVASPVFNDDGTLINYSFVKRDVTEELKNQKKEKEIQEKVVQSQHLETIGQLTNSVAHDFNNILSGIIMAAQLLDMSLDEKNSQSHDLISMIQKSTDRASGLIRSLLNFSRKGLVEFEPLEVYEIIDDVSEILKFSLSKGIKVDIEKNCENIQISGKRQGIESAILNLCVNADHAMKGEGALNIEFNQIFLDGDSVIRANITLDEGSYIQIKISDSGCGIPEDILELIFEPFYTTKDKGKGTGLGLFSVRNIVEDHNGGIQVDTTSGEGTIFSLFLPVYNKHSSQIEVFDVQYKSDGEDQKTVLVIEDEVVVRKLARDLLNVLGHKVILAENGQTGVDRYIEKRDEIDVIFLDYYMPVLGGFEAFNKIRDVDSNAKIVLFSGLVDDDQISKLKEIGLHGLISKPFGIADIEEVLREI